MRLASIVLLLWLGCIPLAATRAATISYLATPIGATDWRLDYVVTTGADAAPLREFTILFDRGSYADLAVVSSPPGWDALVVQPDPGLPDDGFFDALALGSGLGPGGTVAGFAVTARFLGTGAPGPQPFRIVDPVSFATLGNGFTTAVPAPPAGLLAATGVLAGVSRRWRRRAAA